jgi:hypothetical protein
LMKTRLVENGFDLHMPMAQTMAKPVQCALEQPVFIFGGFGISGGGLDNRNLIRREDALIEYVLTISLSENVRVFKCHSEDKVHGVGTKNGCIQL